MPKGIYDRASSAWTPPPTAVYPAELVDHVREVYDAGHTMKETAAICGTTVKVLQRLMPRHGINRRAAAKRSQAGPDNHMWKGDDAGYQALHLRVEQARGKPQECARCGCADDGARYEWANVSGNYGDVNDYERMCVSCHRSYDAARRREIGRSTIPLGLRGDSYV